MIAHNKNAAAPGGNDGVTSQPVRAGLAVTKDRHPLSLGATPYHVTDAMGINDLLFTLLDRLRSAEGAEAGNTLDDVEDEPLSWDERMDWKTHGRHAFDVAPDAPTVAGAGYLIDSEADQRDITECGMPTSLPEDQPVPRVGEPCGSCTGKNRVAGCMCVSDLATPNELLPVYATRADALADAIVARLRELAAVPVVDRTPAPQHASLSVFNVRRTLALAFSQDPSLRLPTSAEERSIRRANGRAAS